MVQDAGAVTREGTWLPALAIHIKDSTVTRIGAVDIQDTDATEVTDIHTHCMFNPTVGQFTRLAHFFKGEKMFASYLYPMYRYPVYPVYGLPYGYPSYVYSGSNFVGSAVGYNSVINTGTATGINQIASPIVI